MLMKPFAGSNKSRSWFWWGINLGVLLALLTWWWMKNKPKEQVGVTLKGEPLVLPDDEPPTAPPEELKPEPVIDREPDNLEVVEGLGPRSAQVLQQAGVHTFVQIAAMEPEAIHEILRGAGVRIAFPETWPQQAALAADGSWEALSELQSSLKGGRRA